MEARVLVKCVSRERVCRKCLKETGNAFAPIHIDLSKDIGLKDFVTRAFGAARAAWHPEEDGKAADEYGDEYDDDNLSTSSSEETVADEDVGGGLSGGNLYAKLPCGRSSFVEILTSTQWQSAIDCINRLPAHLKKMAQIVLQVEAEPTSCPYHGAAARTTCSRRVRFGKRIRRLREALRLPEIRRLMETGLCTPKYIEQQLRDLCSSITRSIARGFSGLKLT